MKQFLLFLLPLIPTYNITAQNLIIFPSKTLNVEYEPNEFTSSEIRFLNNSGDTIILDYLLLDDQFPPSWDYSLCDYGSCNEGVPNSREMAPLAHGEEGFLKMSVFHLEEAEESSIVFLLTNKSDKNDNDTITFVFTPKIVSVENRLDKEEIFMYPNPTTNILNVKNPYQEPLSMCIMSMNGKTVHNSMLLPGSVQATDVSKLPNGSYFVRVANNSGSYTVQKVNIIR